MSEDLNDIINAKSDKIPKNRLKFPLIICLVGSLIVIIAFFLPWIKSNIISFNGINMVKGGIQCFKTANEVSKLSEKGSIEWVAMGISILLFITTPILSSTILIIGFYLRGKSSFFFSILPIIIWLAYLIFGLSYSGKGSLSAYESIGAVITIIGMIAILVGTIILKLKKTTIK